MALLSGLPYDLQVSVPFIDQPRADHLAQIITTVDSDKWSRLIDGSWAILHLVRNALNLDPGSPNAGPLQALHDTLQARVASASPSQDWFNVYTIPQAPLDPPDVVPEADSSAQTQGRRAQLEELQQALMRMYPRKARLAQMVWEVFDVNLLAIAGDASLPIVAQNLITWATGMGNLDDLYHAAGLPPAAREMLVAVSPPPPILTPKQRPQLQMALLSAFPTLDRLRQMVWFELDQNLDVIAGGDDLATRVFNMLAWAEAQGQMLQLIAGAHAVNPNNPALLMFVTQFGRSRLPVVSRDPVTDTVPKLTLDIVDRDRLGNLLLTLPAFSMGELAARVTFLRRAGLSDTWIANFSWAGAAKDAVDQLLVAVQSPSAWLTDQRGYTVLGAVLDQILHEQAVGLKDGLYIASLIGRYKLIDYAVASISPELQALLAQLSQGEPG